MTMSRTLTPAMIRATIGLALLALAGCDHTDPYLRPNVWRPNGANEANLRAMVAMPSDLAVAAPSAHGDGGRAAAALARLRNDQVKPLLNSGLAEVVPVGNGSPAAAPAAAAAATPAGSSGNAP